MDCYFFFTAAVLCETLGIVTCRSLAGKKPGLVGTSGFEANETPPPNFSRQKLAPAY